MTLQDLKRTGMRGIVGARWFLGGNRRIGKNTSSVVVSLDREISFVLSESGLGMKEDHSQWKGTILTEVE